MVKRIAAVLGSGLFLLSADAQTQTTRGEIPFSGTAPGQGIFGSADLTFKLFDAASEGHFLNYSDSQAGVPVAPDDSFSALLGAGTGGDVPADAFAANPAVFVGIELTSMPGIEIAPRVPLFSSAYAQNAASLGKPNGVSEVRGNLNLEVSTPTAGVILQGGSRLLHTIGGLGSLYLGFLSGSLTGVGEGNTGIGTEALRSITSGGLNTALGSSALGSNTNGTFNTATGFAALSRNTGGDYNSAGGYDALLNNDTGSRNTAWGAEAMAGNTLGADNTAIGYTALRANIDGSENTALGAGALYANGGSFNTATGVLALRNNTGSWNTANGLAALYNNTGDQNTASGYHALYQNTTGYANTAVGSSALYDNNIGYANTAVGDYALANNSSGFDNTAIGTYADVSDETVSNATAIGYLAIVNASNKIRLGNGDVTVIEGQVPYTYTSDRNQKENFRAVDADDVLTKLRGLDITSWNYKGQDAKQFRHYGPVAQDFFAAFGDDGVGTIGTPTTITSGDLDGILMIAVQALERRTVEQEKQIADLKAQLDEMKRKVGNKGAAKTRAEF